MKERRLKKARILITKPLICSASSEISTPACFHTDLKPEGNKLKCPYCGAEIEVVRIEQKRRCKNEGAD